MKINYLNYLLTIFLKKLYGASKRFHFPKSLRKLFYSLQYNKVKKDLLPYFYKTLNLLHDPSFKGVYSKKIVWIFWWQGMGHCPAIVRRCLSSIINHTPGHKVILVDRNNIYKYTNIPTYIYTKLKSGVIDFTHFSDIVRFNILRNHGGLWIDATMYSPTILGREYFNNYLYTSGGYEGMDPHFVAGRWIEGLIGGNKSNSMFQFMNQFNRLYWKNNNRLINYFMEDYAFEFIYNHNVGGFKEYVNNVAPGHNPCLFKFYNLLNKRYNPIVYHNILKHTSLFNLTYKKKFIDNGKTYYSKVMGHIK